MRLTQVRGIAFLFAASIFAACSAAASPSDGTSAPASVMPTAVASVAPSEAAVPSALASLAPGASPPADLVGKPWKLAEITETKPPFHAVVPPTDQSRYAIEFHPDSTFKVTADCKQIIGRYGVYRGDGRDNLPLEPGGGGIKFVASASRPVACSPGSLSDRLVTALGNTISFNIDDSNELTITLTDDSKLRFSR